MSFNPEQDRHDELVRTLTRIAKGIESMAAAVNQEAQAITDLQSAISAIGTAIAAEIVALQAAMNAQGVNNTPAIEASVANIKAMTATLNNSLAAPAPPPAPVLPVLTAIAPTSGPAAGGTAVVLTGTGFTGATAVTFSGIPATSFTVMNDTTINAVTPAAVAATQLPVIVTTPNGPSALGPTWSYV